MEFQRVALNFDRAEQFRRCFFQCASTCMLGCRKHLLFHGGVPMTFPAPTEESCSPDSVILASHVQNGIVRISDKVRRGTRPVERLFSDKPSVVSLFLIPR